MNCYCSRVFPFSSPVQTGVITTVHVGVGNTPNQKVFTYWSYQSTVCKENAYEDYKTP